VTLTGTGIICIVTTVYKVIKHLHHSVGGNIQDAQVLSLGWFQKIRVVTKGMPAQANLEEHFEIYYLTT
jgi:hypothetical protein